MASPWITGFVCFTLGPMIASLVLSFTEWDLLSPPQFVGLANYHRMFVDDPLVLHSLRVTLNYCVGAVPLHLILGFSLAMLLNTGVKGLPVFRTVYYLPAVLSGVAVAMLWRWIFSPEYGLLNGFLAAVGVEGPNWLLDERWVIPAFVIMSLWGVGGSMVIYLAGLQGIPTALYEAAMMDGANALERTLHITLPMMSPVIFFQLVMGIINAMKVFTSAFIMTNGGPANASLFYMLYLYRQSFQYFKMGYASAMAWLFFIIVVLLTLLVFRSSSTWVYYEGELRGR